jgi:hypothetical protein
MAVTVSVVCADAMLGATATEAMVAPAIPATATAVR